MEYNWIEPKYVRDFTTDIGTIRIKATDQHILSLEFVEEIKEVGKTTNLIEKTYNQITEYLNGERRSFDIPVYFQGTDYQKRVYEVLMGTQYGEILTYARLSVLAGVPRAYRATGRALSKNKLLLIVPCHRVIRKDAEISGYGGGIKKKLSLIKLENPNNLPLIKSYYKINGKINYLKKI